MKIVIEYESSWRVSTLDGANNVPLPKGGRKYCASSILLSKKDNRRYRPITVNTVMGILNRLIGDRRKLYESRLDEDYFFKDLEKVISRAHFKDQSIENDELLFIRNLSGSTDRNNYAGLVTDDHVTFNSPYSSKLWSVPFMPLEDVLTFIVEGTYTKPEIAVDLNPFTVSDRLEEMSKLKAEEVSPEWQKAIDALESQLGVNDYTLTASGKFLPIAFYCSAIHLMAKKLGETLDVSSLFTPRGAIPGISRRTFSRSDFFIPYTPQRKLAFGNPYLASEFTKIPKDRKRHETIHKMKTASGVLTLNLPISKEKAEKLKEMINNAGVGPFYVGKKGLAHVVEISTEN